MKRYDDIEQGSQEWHEIKWGKIGGTLSKGLFVKSDTLLIDILSQRLEDFEPTDSYSSEAMERGSEMEPFAKQYLEDYTGFKFEATGWIQSDFNELLGISPDGITSDNKIACEVKCFGRKKHTEILLSNEIPNENIHQLIHYFTVNEDLEKLYFIAFRPESTKHFIKEIDLNTEFNIGTKAKPVMKSINELVLMSIQEANKLLEQIKELETQLNF